MLKSKKNQKSNSQYRSYLEILILILSLTQSLSLRADETLPQVSSVDTVTKAEITQESSNSAVTSNTEIPAASVAVDATADNSFFMDYIYSGEPGKPYKSYSKFGFGSDGQKSHIDSYTRTKRTRISCTSSVIYKRLS